MTGSFKERGAVKALLALGEKERRRGGAAGALATVDCPDGPTTEDHGVASLEVSGVYTPEPDTVVTPVLRDAVADMVSEGSPS
jgi:hypothetical protein